MADMGMDWVNSGGEGEQTTTPNYEQRRLTPEESAYYESQSALLKQQSDYLSKTLKQQDLLQPLLMKQLGLNATKDAQGNVTGYEEAPKSQADLDNTKIEDLFRKQTLDALEGNLPVDPGMERDISTQEATLREQMRKQLGTGWETSTPGITAMADFNKRAEELRYNARRGILGQNEQMLGARTGQNLAGQQATFGDILGSNTSNFAGVNAGTALAGTYSGPLSSFGKTNADFLVGSQHNRLQYNADIWKGVSSMFGSVFG